MTVLSAARMGLIVGYLGARRRARWNDWLRYEYAVRWDLRGPDIESLGRA